MEKRFEEVLKTIELLSKTETDKIILSAEIISNALKKGKKVLWCGNGGSAAQAMHFSTELMVKYKTKRTPFPSVSLSADTSLITATGNDFGFDEIFSRQVEGLGKEGDVLVALSTSGSSKNVIKAIKTAIAKKMAVIFLTGADPTEVEDQVDVVIHVPSKNTPIIQECHQIIGHIIIEELEKKLEV